MGDRAPDRLKASLRPPKTLLARIRWIFLLIAILGPVLTVPPLFAATTAWPLQAAALAGILLLVWYWVRGYKRGYFSHAGKVFEGLVVLGVGLVIGTPLHLLSLVYNGLVFRSLYGERRDAAGVALTYVGGFVGAAALSWLLTGSSIPLLGLLPHVISMILLTGVFHLLGTTLARYERAMTREKLLREAGAALVATQDRASVYEVALEVALKLAKESSKVQVVLAARSSEEMIMVASSGDRASEIRGARLDVYSFPKHLCARFFGEQSVEARHSEATELCEALGVALTAESFFMVPLFIEEELRGVLVAASDSAFPQEVKDGLEALGFQIALALESVAFAEDRHWRQSEVRFRSLIQNSSDVVMVLRADGTINYISPSVQRVLGYAPEDLIGKLNFTLLHPDDAALVQRFHAENISTPGTKPALEARMRYLDGSWRHFEGVSNNLLDDPDIRGIVINLRDITDRKAFEEQLKHQAFYDPLTDLANRQLFVDRLKQALRYSRRRGGRKKVAVLFMDLDNFKVVNDSLGHKLGDHLLVAVGERLRGCLRSEDTLARFGGDEFTILVENVEEPADAVRVGKRIIEALREPFVLEGRELFIKPSIGIALGTARTKSPEDLLRDADAAMYRAKEEGLGYRVFEPAMYEQALRRLKLENELQRAIESEEFVVHYQPIVDLRSEEVWGVEALVRWQHPERGLLEPKEFVPAVEESGLVIPMGEWVLKEACEQAKVWQERHPHVPSLVMAVNLSARQLQSPDLAGTVEAVLKETGLKASSLSLDITETVYIKVLEGNTAALDELKRLGVRLSIDDFGVGYSSLSYLKRLPVDTLKIDKSFIRALREDVEDTVILQTIVDLAYTLGLKVVAEGVESKAQAVQLKEMGCDLAQGYYFTEPLTPEAVEEFLA